MCKTQCTWRHEYGGQRIEQPVVQCRQGRYRPTASCWELSAEEGVRQGEIYQEELTGDYSLQFRNDDGNLHIT